MSDTPISPLQVLQTRPRTHGVRVGKISGIHQGSRVVVDFEGNPFGPLLARTTESTTPQQLQSAYQRSAAVLLAFEGNDLASPILMDVLADDQSPGECDGDVDVELRMRCEPNDVVASADAASREEKDKRPVTSAPLAGCQLGRIVAIRDGEIYVEMHGSGGQPQCAKTAVILRNLSDDVLVATPQNGPPVIVGQVFNDAPLERTGSEDAEVVLRGNKVSIEATEAITLKAGGCEIHLDARGKATTTADQIVSRARGANKVQGGSVQLN